MRDALPGPPGRPRLIVIGLGNAFRGDDGAGLAVARALAGDPRVLVHEGEPIDLLDAWDGADEAILVDAARSGAPPGTIHRLDGLADPAGVGGSTHLLGLAETLALARALGHAPARVILYAIEGAHFGSGQELSGPVRDAVGTVQEELRRRLGNSAPGARQDPDAEPAERT